jgi:hypothetical protein
MAKDAKPAPPTGGISTMEYADGSAVVKIFEHIDRGGSHVYYGRGSVEEDFTWTCHTNFSWCVNFNDKASSIDNPTHLQLYLAEHKWYGGSRLYVAAYEYKSNLVPYGWNDRASSMGW